MIERRDGGGDAFGQGGWNQESRADQGDESQGERRHQALAQGGRPALGGGLRRAAQGLAQGLGQQQHRDHRQHHLVAGLMQGQVQQPQHRRQAHDRDLHPTIQQHEQRGQQRHLEGCQVAEVGAFPLHDVLQPGHGHQLDRIDQAPGAVRGDHRRDQGAHAEQSPAADHLQLVGPLLHQRLEGEGCDQQQAEKEAAVQVGPERHHRQQPEGRRAVVFAGVHHLHGPQRQDGQHQEVRPGEPALGGAGQGQRQGAGPAQRLQPARQLRTQDPGQGPDGQAEHQHQSRPAARTPDRRHDDLGQPFQVGPGLAADRIGEGIGLGDLVMVEHPAAGGQVPEGVAVPQQPGREGRRREGGDRADHHHQAGGAGAPGAGRPSPRRSFGRLSGIAQEAAGEGVGCGHPKAPGRLALGNA